MTDSTFQNPSREVLQAFLSLQNDKRFNEILSWLHNSMISESLNATTMENERQRNWTDGKVQAIENILRISNESRDRIEKMDTSYLEDRKGNAY